MSRVRLHLVALVTALAVLPACRALLPFPEPGVEGRDDESCGDFDDQDLDGLVDCADPDCDGACTEESPRCTDGRDNDLDGARDGLDPSCWRERALAAVRCATTEGTDATLVSGADFGWTGRADRLEIDGRSWFTATSGDARVGWAVPLSGAVDGTEIALHLWHPGSGIARITFAPASGVSEDLEVAAQTPTVETVFTDSDIQLFTSGVIAGQYLRTATTRVEFDLVFRFGATVSEVDVTIVGDDAVVRDLRTPTGWRRDEPLVVILEMTVTDPPIRIGDVRVTRPSVQQCGRDVPEIDTPGENRLLDVSRGPEGLCVLASIDPAEVAPRRLRVYESRDAVRFEDRGELAVEGVPTGASLAWSERERAWVGIVAGQDEPVFDAPTPEWTRSLSGPSCGALVVGGSLELPLTGLDAEGVDYSVLRDGTHRITFDYLAMTSSRFGLRTFRSPTGAPGSFAVETDDLGDAYNALRSADALPSIDSVLDQRVVWLELGGELRLARELDGRRWVLEPSSVLVASDIWGQFDRGRILAPRLVMEAPPADGVSSWTGRLFYSGISGAECATCGRIGSADVTVVP